MPCVFLYINSISVFWFLDTLFLSWPGYSCIAGFIIQNSSIDLLCDCMLWWTFLHFLCRYGLFLGSRAKDVEPGRRFLHAGGLLWRVHTQPHLQGGLHWCVYTHPTYYNIQKKNIHFTSYILQKISKHENQCLLLLFLPHSLSGPWFASSVMCLRPHSKSLKSLKSMCKFTPDAAWMRFRTVPEAWNGGAPVKKSLR